MSRVQLPRQSLGLLLGLTLGVALCALVGPLVAGVSVVTVWLVALVLARWL